MTNMVAFGATSMALLEPRYVCFNYSQKHNHFLNDQKSLFFSTATYERT